MNRARFAFLLSFLSLAACHSSSSPTSEVGCPSGATCDQPTRGPVHGLRSDGTVDVTVPEIWPNRAAEVAPLTPDEVAKACAVLARCADENAGNRLELLSLCASGGAFGWAFWEQRAVPTIGKNERFVIEARDAIAHAGDCAEVRATTTMRPAPIYCEEDGCWWMDASRPLPTVTCTGDVATLTTVGQAWIRDCGRALAHCDPTSPTGCTDRAPLGCDSKAIDRCDGDVHVGCDHTGRVSFRDCARVGATCQMQGTSAVCVPKASDCTEPSPPDMPPCDGGNVKLCIAGKSVSVPFADVGITSCTTP